MIFTTKMDNKISYKVTKKEIQLLRFMREKYQYGTIEVIVHAGQPSRIKMQHPADVVLDGNIGTLDKI